MDKSQLLKLAQEHPEIRTVLVPMMREASHPLDPANSKREKLKAALQMRGIAYKLQGLTTNVLAGAASDTAPNTVKEINRCVIAFMHYFEDEVTANS